MRRRIFVGSLLVVLLLTVISTFQISKGDAAPSAPVRVTIIAANCDADGDVSGLITVQNVTSGKVSYSIPLVLTEHIPPSQGGDPKFQPVSGATTVVEVNLPGGATLGFNYGPLSTANVDSRANALRVEVDVDVDPVLNPEKSESFPPCVRVTPTPTPTPTPISLVPPMQVLPSPTPTPVPPGPKALPPTGGQPPRQEESSSPLVKSVLGGGLLLTIIAGHLVLVWRRRLP